MNENIESVHLRCDLNGKTLLDNSLSKLVQTTKTEGHFRVKKLGIQIQDSIIIVHVPATNYSM